MRKVAVSVLLLVAVVALLYAYAHESTGLQATFPDGSAFHVDQYKGKVVLLEFLSTVCPHCMRSSQEIEKVYPELKPKGFEVVGIALNAATPDMVNGFIRDNGLSFPIAIGQEPNARKYLDFPDGRIFYVPRLVFLDKKGEIHATYEGSDTFVRFNEEENIRQLANKLLAE